MNRFCLRVISRVVILFSTLLFAGCAVTPPLSSSQPLSREALEAFALEGRFSLRQGDKSYSGRLSWRHAGGRDELLLASPFGQGIAEITVNAHAATLTTNDGKTYSATDVQMLTEQVLGYGLPLGLLTDWVRGRSALARFVEHDAHGRLLRLRHEDWRVDYDYDSDDPLALPGRLFAERLGAFELRLRIDEWTRLPPRETTP